MTAKFDKTTYKTELDKRLDEIIAWAVKECPIKNAHLSYADFAKARDEFHQIATGELKTNNPLHNPEPEEGGAQYINDNPAPWP